MSNSVNDNVNGVDLSEIEAGDKQPINTDHGRLVAEIKYANHAEDEYLVQYGTAYESFEEVVDGDAFLQKVTELDNHITDEELAQLEVNDVLSIFAEGHERMTRVLAKDIDRENNRVAVRGECNCQTISRWVDQELIRLPGE